MKIQVSELIVKFMQHLGINTVFGMPGAHILPVYNQLYHSNVKTVLAKHEQGAAFMACGYARVSNQISACITTAGPGATNLITGIANAFADKQAILVITGEAPTYIFGKGGLQESTGEGGNISQVALFNSITGYAKVIERTDYLASVLNKAAKILFSKNPLPVLLSIPYNVQKEWVDDSVLQQIISKNNLPSFTQNTFSLSQAQILLTLLKQAKHPVIISGYGCIKSNAQTQVSELSTHLNIPVCSSLKGKGSIDESDALSLGTLGVTSGGYAYHYITEHADLLIILGASFNERTSYVWNEKILSDKKIVQIDINEENLNKVFISELAIEADIKIVLKDALKLINNSRIKKKKLATLKNLKHHCDPLALDHNCEIFKDDFSLIKSFYNHFNAKFQSNVSIFDDNIIFSQNLLNMHTKNSFYPNAGISSLGHAVPAAIGAQFFCKTRMFSIIGDGGFQMCCMEIMTAVNYNIPLNIILFNNASMGLIRKNQVQSYDRNFIDCDFVNPNYYKLAQSFGIKHHLINSESTLQVMFENTNFKDDINLIEIIIDKDAFPNYLSKR